MVNMRRFFQKTGLRPYEGKLGKQLLSLQYDHLRKHIPLLYITICFYFVLAVIFIASDVNTGSIGGFMASYILPAIIVPISLIRAITWYRRRNDDFDPQKAAKIMISLTWISALIAFMCGLWAVFAWQAEDNGERFYIPLIMAMGGFSVAYCLAIIPFSAALNLILTVLPISIILLVSGDTLLIVISITVMTAVLYLMGLLRRHFAQMVKMTKLQLQMHEQASTDMLTGLLNRRAFNETFTKLKSKKKADHNRNISIAMIDLDRFKPINDRYGHATGDRLLQMIAQRMRNEIGDMAYIARLGGDEFAVIFDGKAVHYCRDFLAKISAQLSQPYNIGNVSHEVGISYGLTHNIVKDANLGKLLSEADAALYRMKADKKSQNPDPSNKGRYNINLMAQNSN